MKPQVKCEACQTTFNPIVIIDKNNPSEHGINGLCIIECHVCRRIYRQDIYNSTWNSDRQLTWVH